MRLNTSFVDGTLPRISDLLNIMESGLAIPFFASLSNLCETVYKFEVLFAFLLLIWSRIFLNELNTCLGEHRYSDYVAGLL